MVKDEIRNLMHKYIDRQEKLREEYVEAKEDNDVDGMLTSECLQRQCRIMIAELWHTMVKIGALDQEEIEFGSIKVK